MTNPCSSLEYSGKRHVRPSSGVDVVDNHFALSKKQRTPFSSPDKVARTSQNLFSQVNALPSSSSSNEAEFAMLRQKFQEQQALLQTQGVLLEKQQEQIHDLLSVPIRYESKTISHEGVTYQFRRKFQGGVAVPEKDKLKNSRNEVVYRGETLNNLPHGYGEWHFPDGGKYVGEWSFGLRHGQGEYFYADKTHYKGEWKSNLRHGRGEMRYTNKESYIGEFLNDQQHGHGKYIWLNEEKVYEGQWVNGQRTGSGILISKELGTYTGEFKNNLIHGKGRYEYANGEIYNGDWIEGIAEGFCEQIDFQGTIYKGQVQNGIQSGYGEFVHYTGESYNGHWKNGKYEGYGEVCHSSGDKYLGYWKNGCYHGNGEFHFSNGDIIRGTWLEGSWQGVGELQLKDNTHCKGEFSDDRKRGNGEILYPNGDRYQGPWKNRTPHGYGEYAYADGRIFTGNWASGVMHGSGKMTYPNGDIFEGEWLKMLIQGKKRSRIYGNGVLTCASGKKIEGRWINAIINALINGKPCYVKKNRVSATRIVMKNSRHIYTITEANGERKNVLITGSALPYDVVPLKSLDSEKILTLLNEEGTIDVASMRRIAPKIPTPPMPENPRPLKELLSYVDSLGVDPFNRELVMYNLNHFIDKINANNQATQSPLIQIIRLHLWGIMEIFDDVEIGSALKKNALTNLGMGITPITCLHGAYTKVVVEYRRLKGYVEDYTQSIFAAAEKYKVGLLNEMSEVLVRKNKLEDGNQIHFVNAGQVYFSQKFGFDSEMAILDASYKDFKPLFKGSEKKGRVREFFKLYKAETMLDDIWNTINEATDQYGATLHLGEFRDCIKDFIMRLEPFAKPKTLEGLLDDRHILSKTAKELIAANVLTSHNIDYVYKEVIDEFILKSYFEINPDIEAPYQIKRSGINLVLKIMGFLR